MFKSINTPYWTDSYKKKSYEPLNKDIKVDVAIIGGGISGITAACLLKEKGLKVALIDAKEIISGVSSHTTAKITAQHDLRLHKIYKWLGKKFAKDYAEANTSAIDMVEKLATKYNADCDLVRTFSCLVTAEDKYITQIEDETETAIKLGIDAEFLLNPEFEILNKANIKAGLRFNNQAQFNPVKYLNKLAESFDDGNCSIFENTRAVNLIKGNPNVVVTDKNFKISADNIIVATHYPFIEKYGLYFTELYPERSYLCSFLAEEEYKEGMFKTVEEDFSLRFQTYNDKTMFIIGGGYHDTGIGYYMHKNYLDLRKRAEELFTVKEFLWQWSAQDYGTPDNIPYAGLLSPMLPNVYVMTGYDKWGMTNATAAAVTVSELITEGKFEYADLYNPRRFVNSFNTAFTYLKNNIKTVYRLVSGRLKILPRKSDIKKGEARLIKIKGVRCGVYRDNEGEIHIVRATCRHMGCQLYFNDAEITWDCPCHGSRYDIDGKLIEAPADKPLQNFKNSY